MASALRQKHRNRPDYFRMTRHITLLLFILCLGFSFESPAQTVDEVAAKAAEADAGTGLPLPRFASLKSDNVYVRTGPSMDYPIKWIFKKEGLPVEIIQEFDSWRKIKDPKGEVGWAHKILLSGKKTASITEDNAVAYDDPAMGKPVVRFEKGVIVNVDECEKLICRVHSAPYEGWIEKKYLWGVYGSDIFN